MISGVMCGGVPRLPTCELRRVKARRRLTVRDRWGSVTGDGRGRNTGMQTSASEFSVWNTIGHICISSGIRFGDSPTVKLYSNVAVGDAGAVLKDRASYAGGMAISCGTEADMSEPGLPRAGDGALSGLNVDALGLGAPRVAVSSTSTKFPSLGETGTPEGCILLPDMVEKDVPGRVAVDGRRT